MTFLLCLLGVVMVGVSGRLFAHAIVVPRLQLKVHLREIQDYGFESGQEDDIGSRGSRSRPPGWRSEWGSS